MNHADYARFEWLESYVSGGEIRLQSVPDGLVELSLTQKGASFHVRRPTLREAVDAAIEATET